MRTTEEILESYAHRGRLMLPLDDIPTTEVQRLGLIINYAPNGKTVNIFDGIYYKDGSYGDKLQKISKDARLHIADIISGSKPKGEESYIVIDYNDDMCDDIFMKSWILHELEDRGYTVEDDPIDESFTISLKEWEDK